MLSSPYAEDLFEKFCNLIDTKALSIQYQDLSPISSFHLKIISGGQLTKNQANYIIKLLEKYKNLAMMAGLDYRQDLANLKWKQSFRTLDLSKKIYIERNKNKSLDVCLKFPYQLKKEFEEEISPLTNNFLKTSTWDPEDKIRRLSFYDYNLISLYEFASKHNFEIDESFLEALADVEEIWQHSEDLIPKSTLQNVADIELINANVEVQEYFYKNRTGNVVQDAFLAKSMGYPFDLQPVDPLMKILSSTENTFWIKENKMLFDIFKEISGKICILLDRASDSFDWIKKFVLDADQCDISRDTIKVCFRDSKDTNSGLNDWIKNEGVGGKVEKGRILIFESKPAKWLFKDINDVKILVTNNIYPPTNSLAKDWFSSHPCVIYLGDTKPTETKGQKIVEL